MVLPDTKALNSGVELVTRKLNDDHVGQAARLGAEPRLEHGDFHKRARAARISPEKS
ncbi:MAG: hypothetical protein LBR53_08220 [Deltaproteobacteria bacterium]|jgi:hypothetical protein|nr:hypothetical protein [Deltaproteobacteria bacterium]